MTTSPGLIRRRLDQNQHIGNVIGSVGSLLWSVERQHQPPPQHGQQQLQPLDGGVAPPQGSVAQHDDVRATVVIVVWRLVQQQRRRRWLQL
jgi:hypothetical protein